MGDDDGFMEFIDSLIWNLVDLRNQNDVYDQALHELIKALEESLMFVKIFILVVKWRGFEHTWLEYFCAHVEVVVANAARVSFIYWFDRDDEDVCNEMKLEISELLLKIRLVDPMVRETYIKVLGASNLSGLSCTLTLETYKYILGQFVDSLLGYLWELLNYPSSFMLSMKDGIQQIYEGLRFLRTIFLKQEEKFDELDDEVKDLIGAMINEAGIIIYFLSTHEFEDGSAKEMELVLFGLLEKFKLIKTRDANKFLLMPRFDFPKTCKVESIAFAKDQIQTVREDLVFLRSFLKNIMEKRSQHENLQALWSRVIEVAHKADSVIDSLVVGDGTSSSSILLSTIRGEIKLIMPEASEIYDNTKYGFKGQNLANTSSPVSSEGSFQKNNEVVVGLNDESTQSLINSQEDQQIWT
ncbi:hypothetical protein ACH5RR_016288 [Cinchona calisaya]|uniref:Late blight resistance protein R1A-like N-terminal domain-containing protein n=1 Tax=Cinchona calisaya TaxID=153742 RepID=A0ABD2ZVK4_9GENT